MSRNRGFAILAKIAVPVLAVLLAAGCGGAKEKEQDKIVAVYKLSADSAEERTVTLAELESFVNVSLMLNPMFAYFESDPTFRRSMLEQLVASRILASRLEEDVYQKTVEQAEADYKAFIKQYEESVGKKEMDNQFKEYRVTGEDIKDYAVMSALTAEYLNSRVSDDQVRQKFDNTVAENPNAYVKIATVSHILIGTVDPQTKEEKRTKEEALALANEVREKLLAGANFAAMAKQYSEDEGSKDNGGTYENAEIDSWVENFRKAVLELPLREVSEPVETEYGYHLIRVEDRKVPTFDDVKEEIRGELVQLEFTEFMDKEFKDLLVKTDLPQPETEDEAGDSGGAGSGNGSNDDQTDAESSQNADS